MAVQPDRDRANDTASDFRLRRSTLPAKKNGQGRLDSTNRASRKPAERWERVSDVVVCNSAPAAANHHEDPPIEHMSHFDEPAKDDVRGPRAA